MFHKARLKNNNTTTDLKSLSIRIPIPTPHDIDFHKLVRHSTKAKEALDEMQNNERLANDATLFAKIVNSGDWENAIFNRHDAWKLALFACQRGRAHGGICVDQYATVMIRWALASDYKDYVTSVKAKRLKDISPEVGLDMILANYLISLFREMPGGRIRYDNMIESGILINEILTEAKRELNDEDNVIFIYSAVNLHALMERFEQMNFHMLAPIWNNNGWDILVPSYPLIKFLHKKYISCYNDRVGYDLCKIPYFELMPVIGSLTANDIVTFHTLMRHPCNLSIPTHRQIAADGFNSGCYGFIFHDVVYHWERLSQHPDASLFIQCTNILKSLYEDWSGKSHLDTLSQRDGKLYQEYRYMGVLLNRLMDMEQTIYHYFHAFLLAYPFDKYDSFVNVFVGYLVGKTRDDLLPKEMTDLEVKVMDRCLLTIIQFIIINRDDILLNHQMDASILIQKMLVDYQDSDAEISVFETLKRMIKQGYIENDHAIWLRKVLVDLSILKEERHLLDRVKLLLLPLLPSDKVMSSGATLFSVAQNESKQGNARTGTAMDDGTFAESLSSDVVTHKDKKTKVMHRR